jgi:hypothetical protein
MRAIGSCKPEMVTHVKNNLITLLGPECNDFIAWLNALENRCKLCTLRYQQ